MNFPKHIELIITHQPQATNYETVQEWISDADHCDIQGGDKAAMIASGEVWEVHWYPVTPVGFYCVAAATLERALEIACEVPT